MKKFYLSCFLIIIGVMLHAQQLSPIAQEVNDARQTGNAFIDISAITTRTQPAINLSEINNQQLLVYFDYNTQTFNEAIMGNDAKAYSLSISLRTDLNITLDLVEVPETFYFYDVVTSSGTRKANNEKARHFRGVVRGSETSSIAAISLFENEMMGTVSLGGYGNFNIGKLKNSDTHIIFSEDNVSSVPNLECDTPDDAEGLPYRPEDLMQSDRGRAMEKCVKLYFETEVDMFQTLGSVTAVENYVTGLFNNVATLYQNESITTEISEIFVWDTTDPYNGTNTLTLLNEFQAQTTTLNGDLGQLLTFRNAGGGRAAGFNGLCNPDIDQSLSVSANLELSFPNVPAYSWSVMVVTHEFGHLFGSRHTHACVWNGNNTGIDSCSPFGMEGGCPPPGIPANGGTIMSYCHLQPVGIDFTQGFGPQPGNVIRNSVDNAQCLENCMMTACDCVHDVLLEVTQVDGCYAEFYLSFAIDGCAELIDEFTWDFGDTNGDVTNGLPVFNDHTYTSNGTYTVTVSFVVRDVQTGEPCEIVAETTVEITECEGEPPVTCCATGENFLVNGDFNQATCGGNGAFNSSCVPNWIATDGSPSINGFGTDPNAWMWSYGGNGEAIAGGFDFVEGETYTICFRIRTDDRDTGDPNVHDFATVNLVATNNAGNVTASPNGDIIFQDTMGPYLNTWTDITVTFTPDANYSQLWIFPFMAQPSDGISQAEMNIDDIVITGDCCDEFDNADFFLGVSQGSDYSIWVDNFDDYASINGVHEWYVLSSPNATGGPYTPVYSTVDNGPGPITLINDAQFGLYYTVVHKVITDCGELCYAQVQYQNEGMTPENAMSSRAAEIDCCFIFEYWPNGPGDPADFTAEFQIGLDLGGNIITQVTNDYSGNPNVTHEWYLYTSPNPTGGPYTLVDQQTGVNYSYGPITDGLYYFLIHKVYSDCGEACYGQSICRNCEREGMLCDICGPIDCSLIDEIDKDCTTVQPPQNLQVVGDTLTWDPVPGAVEYIVSSPPGNVPQIDCRCGNSGVSIAPITTQDPFVTLPISLQSKCFVWWVRAVCSDGTESEQSEQQCFWPIRAAEGGFEKALVAPNPNDGNMTFVIETSYDSEVTIEVYDFYGKLVQVFVENVSAHSEGTINWDAAGRLARGVYFVTFRTDVETLHKKVIIE